VGQPQHVGNVPEVLDDLRGDADRDHAVLVEPRDAGLRLDEGVIDERRPVAPLDDDVGLPEARLDVALADLPARDDVPRRLEARRVGLHRGLGIEDTGEVPILDGHAAGPVLGRLLRLRGHQRDRLPEKPDDLVREDLRPRPERAHRRRLARDVAEEDVVRDVAGREHAADAGDGLGRARVDPHDPRRRPRGAHDLCVEHAAHREVVRVSREPEDLVAGVRARRPLAHDAEGGGAGLRGSGRAVAHGATGGRCGN
jgi:hypothetical protein